MEKSFSNKSYKVVYTVVERPDAEKKVWLRLGVAFVNRDGSMNVKLDAMPVSGQLHIRDPQEKSESLSNGSKAEVLTGT